MESKALKPEGRLKSEEEVIWSSHTGVHGIIDQAGGCGQCGFRPVVSLPFYFEEGIRGHCMNASEANQEGKKEL